MRGHFGIAGLILRNLIYFRWTNLAVIGGVAAAASVLTGALLVGESVRGSLRDLAFRRIGAAAYVLSADRFFREELADELVGSTANPGARSVCPVIFLQGAIVHEGTGARAYDVNVFGVDDRFWQFQNVAVKTPEARTALVGAELAKKLAAGAGDTLLLRIETGQGIPRESLYGRRENISRIIRLTCGEILGPERLGEFALRSDQRGVHTIFVPLARLQKDLGQPSRVNAILLGDAFSNELAQVRRALRETATLEDLGITLRQVPGTAAISIESPRLLLDDHTAQEAFNASQSAGRKAAGIFTYLANSIRSGSREIPYSVISAVDLQSGAVPSLSLIQGWVAPPGLPAQDPAIWLTDWAQEDLRCRPGDTVEVEYYLWHEEGRLTTQTARFKLAGVVSLGKAGDPHLAPQVPGITDAEHMGAWDPPFPLDLRRIRAQDEDYWERFRTTPKAFIALKQGQDLWRSRFGSLTSVRMMPSPGMTESPDTARVAADLQARLDPERSGFTIADLRGQAAAASRGSTSFGEYFLYFSSFLIVSAVLLSALFFRLGVEQRAAEVGMLRAAGFSNRKLLAVFLIEGGLLSAAGGILGMLGAIGYSRLLVAGLRSWWLGAVGTREIFLHASWGSLLAGLSAGILASLAGIAWTLRGLRIIPARSLLAGVVESRAARARRTRGLIIIASSAMLAAIATSVAAALEKLSQTAGFFGAGCLMLISLLCLTAAWLRTGHPKLVAGKDWVALLRLGSRNASHRPGRSLLSIALIAAATFIIVSMEAFRRDTHSLSLERDSGTGGYPLIAQSAIPVVHDPDSAPGREALGIAGHADTALAGLRFVPFRMRQGDDASCLNLYAPREPRILGASRAFFHQGRFAFQRSLADTPSQIENPWLLLDSDSADGAIPAAADANTIQYILHLALGDEITIRGGSGAPVRLRLVAALRDSVFQGELLISEASFLRIFPAQEGFQWFLIEAPAGANPELARSLETSLAPWGFRVESSLERLESYHAIENTYLSTFQSLGALGLILGTFCLGAVLLRNTLERRKELALLQAVGYRKLALAGIIVGENLVLLSWGLICGAASAWLAIVPALQSRGIGLPPLEVGFVLIAILLAGSVSSILAVRTVLRSRLLEFWGQSP